MSAQAITEYLNPSTDRGRAGESDRETGSGAHENGAAVASNQKAGGARDALLLLLRRRAKKFTSLASQIDAGATPKTIHDTRVWSRRLEQALGALLPKPRSGKARRLRRTPRRVRRGLGHWRNCDVLLEMIAKEQRRSRSEVIRKAWTLVRDYLEKKRNKEIARAQKRLQREALSEYFAQVQRLLAHPGEGAPEVPLDRLRDSAQRARQKWHAALERARETQIAEDLHALRIATKALRYRLELLNHLGDKQVTAPIRSLARLQDALGRWHDGQVLDQTIADAVARSKILLDELPSARILLARLERKRRRDADRVQRIFRLAKEQELGSDGEDLRRSPQPAPESNG